MQSVNNLLASHMIIKSLNLKLDNVNVITDIDDCLMLSSKSIRSNNFSTKSFFFDSDIYDEHKKKVFSEAELTDWGKEFISLIESGEVKDYLLITSGRDRIDILCEKFGVDSNRIMENMSNNDKLIYLNQVKEESLYVDDKTLVINEVRNDFVKCINYPVRTGVGVRRMKRNRIS